MAYCQSRDEAFKYLLMKLSHNMDQENVQDLAVMANPPLRSRSGTHRPTAIEVLRRLWERGDFSPNSCASLDILLRSIARCDLAELVRQYMHTYGASDPPPKRNNNTDDTIQQPVQEMETRRVKDPTVSLPPVTRTASGPSTVSTPQDHGNVAGSEQCAAVTAEEVPVRLTPPDKISEPRRAFSCDQLEEGSLQPMKSQVSYSSFPFSSQHRLQGSGEMSSGPSVAVSGESLPSSAGSLAPQIAIHIGNITISSNSDHSGNSNHSSPLSPAAKGPTHSGTNSKSNSSSKKSSSMRHHRSSNSEQEKISRMFSPLHEVEHSEEEIDDRKEFAESENTVRHKAATDMSAGASPMTYTRGRQKGAIDIISPMSSPKTDRRGDKARHKGASLASSPKSDGGIDIVRRKGASGMSPLPSPKHEDGLRLSEKQIKGIAEATSESLKEGRKWKIFGRVPRPKKIRELTKQCTWVVKKEQLGSFIWNHKHHQSYIKYPRKLQVDVDCGDLNPWLSLQLYPFGLFTDEGTSVTMVVKMSIPDDCPPIPPTDTYSLSWDICIVNEGNKGKLLGGSKKPMKVSFDKGTVHVRKFFPHATIKHCTCDKFEIHVYTSYTCQENEALVQEASGGAAHHMLTQETPTLVNLLNFKMGGGEVMNIAKEVGGDYQRFGQFLLRDDTGNICKQISQSNSDEMFINRAILKLWVQGKGKQPAQWMTLLDVLRGIEMTALANRIEHNLQLNTND